MYGTGGSGFDNMPVKIKPQKKMDVDNYGRSGMNMICPLCERKVHKRFNSVRCGFCGAFLDWPSYNKQENLRV
jgi:ribosomal protein L37AE/L43A